MAAFSTFSSISSEINNSTAIPITLPNPTLVWLKLNATSDASGTTLYNYASGTYNCSQYNFSRVPTNPTISSTKVRGANSYSLALNPALSSTNNWLRLPTQNFSSGTPWSYCVWINFTSQSSLPGNTNIFNFCSSSANNDNTNTGTILLALQSSGVGQCHVLLFNGGNNQLNTVSNLYDGNWHHYCITSNGSSGNGINVYLDGVAIATAKAYTNESLEYFAFGLAGWDAGQIINGYVSDIRGYNICLSPTQVGLLYSTT